MMKVNAVFSHVGAHTLIRAAMHRCSALAFFLITFGSLIAQTPINKFSDPVIREIRDLIDHRDAAGLLPYLRDSNLIYRGEALMGFGSVTWICRDTMHCVSTDDSIAKAMDCEIDGIRIAGAFALGQSGTEEAAVQIRRLIESEQKPLVKGMLFEALGKCGNQEDLAWLAAYTANLQESEGQAMGFFRFALRGLSSPAGNDRVLALCSGGTSLAGMNYTSYQLGRYADMEWLKANAIQIRQLLDKERDPIVRSQLVRAVIKAEGEEAWPLAEYILKSPEDYRVKVNILNSMRLLPWNKAGKLVYDLAVQTDPSVAIAAAEAIQINAVYTDLQVHLKAIDQAVNWRSRALLLDKGLELVQGKANLMKKMQKSVMEYYQNARHASEKAWLLKALKGDPTQYLILTEKIGKGYDPVISTSALETLIAMRGGAGFESAKANASKKGLDLEQEFLQIFKTAVASGDVAQVSLAAAALRDPELNYKSLLNDYEFLQEALNNSQNSDQFEARNELTYTLAYLMDQPIPPMAAPGFNHPIDWERVMKVHPRQQLVFITSKGEILVQLNLNWCPGTVSAFLELIERGYFNGKLIHRVVPNFVAQDGCPRVDGWGGPEFTIRSEFSPAPFLEGTLGMASAGKDTEGSQWYFTHSPTPHLDARYTNFGYVLEGMEVVHQLEVGDMIERIEWIEMKQ